MLPQDTMILSDHVPPLGDVVFFAALTYVSDFCEVFVTNHVPSVR